ncbi:MAG: FAD-dependent oxidoreductase [Anaerolineales bacterium]|nr:FAD-dependent oxidoreductase [Anaerolineales bacterium]
MTIQPRPQIVRRKRQRRQAYTIETIQQVTHDTWKLTFNGPPMEHLPGQYLVMRRMREDEKPEPHAFSISSSPFADALEITVKETGDFTATIGGIKPGEDVTLDGPFGQFSYVIHDAENLAFIAGGIGVTPFISMLRDLSDRGFGRNVRLIWGNKHERDIVYRDEVDALSAAYPQFKLIHILSEQEEWEGEAGFVSSELLKRALDFHTDTQYFICGPAAMNDLVVQFLMDFNIAQEKIHTEKFTSN